MTPVFIFWWPEISIGNRIMFWIGIWPNLFDWTWEPTLTPLLINSVQVGIADNPEDRKVCGWVQQSVKLRHWIQKLSTIIEGIISKKLGRSKNYNHTQYLSIIGLPFKSFPILNWINASTKIIVQVILGKSGSLITIDNLAHQHFG